MTLLSMDRGDERDITFKSKAVDGSDLDLTGLDLLFVAYVRLSKPPIITKTQDDGIEKTGTLGEAVVTINPEDTSALYPHTKLYWKYKIIVDGKPKTQASGTLDIL